MSSGGLRLRTFSWTAQRLEILQLLWEQSDKAAAAIAAELNQTLTPEELAGQIKCSRNAVISKANRVGLKPRVVLPEKTAKRQLVVSSPSKCAFPIGHPGEPDFHFCGEQPESGRPYCRRHCAIAYQPLTKKDAREAA